MPVDREAGERLQAFMEPRIGKVQPWAEKHGVGRDTIYALWRGREPRPDTLARLARAMGVDYLELLAIRGRRPTSHGDARGPRGRHHRPDGGYRPSGGVSRASTGRPGDSGG